ncbi:GNAT family N-acetyltransferase [Virgibacillus phasianinus]|uniref:GNAT family N-acetyltransferase n=1 Tax=Virgibacillus phasianinus TaxID=2017483 RepID=A0A220U110_9BACI|nr:GNAT family N-acetyltransferase [Virgibacillus phasianinus]ASK61511.1 GNAT family N-acetyltransferase [Virgibacillus phasianinus]
MNITDQFDQQDFNFIKKKVVEYNMEELPDEIKTANEDIAFMLKDDNGEIIGGITANMFWHHIHIEFLWVDKRYRKDGYGSLLLERLEDYAREQKCRLIYLDSFSFQAPGFYQKNDYEIFGKLDDHPKGYALYFLQKQLG